MYFINTRKSNKNISDASVIYGQQVPHLKTVGRLRGRYRLVHWWVAETLLNVQSVSSITNV